MEEMAHEINGESTSPAYDFMDWQQRLSAAQNGDDLDDELETSAFAMMMNMMKKQQKQKQMKTPPYPMREPPNSPGGGRFGRQSFTELGVNPLGVSSTTKKSLARAKMKIEAKAAAAARAAANSTNKPVPLSVNAEEASPANVNWKLNADLFTRMEDFRSENVDMNRERAVKSVEEKKIKKSQAKTRKQAKKVQQSRRPLQERNGTKAKGEHTNESDVEMEDVSDLAGTGHVPTPPKVAPPNPPPASPTAHSAAAQAAFGLNSVSSIPKSSKARLNARRNRRVERVVPQEEGDTGFEESEEALLQKALFIARQVQEEEEETKGETSSSSSSSEWKKDLHSFDEVMEGTSPQSEEASVTLHWEQATQETPATQHSQEANQGVFSVGFSEPKRNHKKAQSIEHKQSKNADLSLKCRQEAEELFGTGKYRLAWKRIEKACKVQPSDMENVLCRAQINIQLGKWQEAIEDFNFVLLRKHRETDTLLSTIEVFRKVGCFTHASRLLFRLNEALSQANFPNSIEMKEKAEEERKILEESSSSFKQACKDVGENSSHKVTQVECNLTRLLELCPHWPCAHLLASVWCLSKESTEEESELQATNFAKDALAQILNFSLPSSLGPLIEQTIPVSNCNEETGDSIARIVRRIHRSNRADVAFKVLDVIESVFVDIEGSLKRSCKSERMFLLQLKTAKDTANSLFNKKLYPQAIFRYKEALKLDPEHDIYNAVILCNRAAALMATNKFEEAIGDCDSALKKWPAYTKARIRRARANVALNKLKIALDDLEEAYSRNPCKELQTEIESIKLQQRQKREAKNEERNRARQSKYDRKREQQHDQPPRTGFNFRHEEGNNNTVKDQPEFYKRLGVIKSASQNEIKKSYHKLALKYHPDKTGEDKEAQELFKLIAEAYETLRDPIKRKEYDLKNQPSIWSYQSAYTRSSATNYSSYYYQRSSTSGSSSYYYYC